MVRGIYPVVATIDSDGWSLVATMNSATVTGLSSNKWEARHLDMPYVAPEQAMTDRADFAHEELQRARHSWLRYEHGIVLVAENTSQLRKVSEIYDRIAFAGVGKYNEFDQLRVAGIRSAELTGYQYSRDDVDAEASPTVTLAAPW